MKCDNCKYIYYPEYESSYTSCRVFGDEPPEKYMRKDGEGCICNNRQLEKILKLNEDAWNKEAKAFVEWYEKELKGENNAEC